MTLNNVKTFFKKIDVFEQPILLSFKGKTFYKTWTGGVFTFLLISVIVGFSFEAIISLIIRENIQVAFSEIYEDSPPLLEISPDQGFTFGFGFVPAIINHSMEKYFDIEVENIIVRRMDDGTQNTSSIKKRLKTCNQSDFPKDYNYRQNNLNWKCIDNNQTLRISGKFYSSVFEYVQLNVIRCVNSTLNNYSCATSEELDQLMRERIYLSFIFSNKIINLQDYQNPMINYLESSVFFLIDPKKIFKQADILFRKNSIVRDDNLWFHQRRESSEMTYDYFREFSRDLVDDTVASFFLRASEKRGYYIVSAEKITLMLSRLGGLVSLFYHLMNIFMSIYTRKKLLISLSNFLYKYLNPNKSPGDITFKAKEEAKGSKETTGLKKTLPKKIPILFKNRVVAVSESPKNKESNTGKANSIIIDQNKDPENKAPEQFSKTEKIKNYLLKFQKIRFDIIGSFLRKIGIYKKKNNPDAVIMEKAFKKLSIDMDIAEILQKNKELDRLKDLLFESQDRTLFEFFPRPVLQVKLPKTDFKKMINKKKSINIVLKAKIRPSNDFLKRLEFLKGAAEKHELSSYLELYNAFMILKSKPSSEISERTLRLMKFVEQPLKEIFNLEDLQPLK